MKIYTAHLLVNYINNMEVRPKNIADKYSHQIEIDRAPLESIFLLILALFVTLF